MLYIVLSIQPVPIHLVFVRIYRLEQQAGQNLLIVLDLLAQPLLQLVPVLVRLTNHPLDLVELVELILELMLVLGGFKIFDVFRSLDDLLLFFLFVRDLLQLQLLLLLEVVGNVASLSASSHFMAFFGFIVKLH